MKQTTLDASLGFRQSQRFLLVLIIDSLINIITLFLEAKLYFKLHKFV